MGCGPSLEEKQAMEKGQSKEKAAPVSVQTSNYGKYVTVVIDQCEYIEVEDGWADQRTYTLIHKGNCKNHNSNTK